MRAAGYVRALTSEAIRPGLDPREQRKRIEAFVDEQGWSLAGIAQDVGLDAKAGRRPALQHVLEDLAGIDRLVVAGIDRLGGSSRTVSEFLDRLAAAGVGLVSLAEDFDTGSPSGRAVTSVLRRAARWEQRGGRARKGAWTAAHLKPHGFSPRTVIDVGVADGTPALYEAFRDAYIVLIEPLPHFEADLTRLANSLGAEYIATAIGSSTGRIEIRVDERDLFTSSVLESVVPRPELTAHEVPITTLDDLVEQRGWAPPFGLKVDVEGFEREVIEGADAFLAQTEFVLAEVHPIPRFRNSVPARELIALLDKRGFGVCDIVDAARSGFGSHADLLFGRKRR
jgi:FkbM family methyltransferase